MVFAILAGMGFCLTWWEKEYKMRKELNTAYGLKSGKVGGSAKASPDGLDTGVVTPIDIDDEEIFKAVGAIGEEVGCTIEMDGDVELGEIRGRVGEV
jgi:hypothetical protein